MAKDLKVVVNCIVDYGTRLVMTPEDAVQFSRIMDRSQVVRTCYSRDEIGQELYHKEPCPRITMEVGPFYVFENRAAYDAFKEANATAKEEEANV